MTLFWILWWLVACIAAVALWFFFRGLRLATGNPRYFTAWARPLGYLALALAASPWLASHGHGRIAWVLLGAPAVLCGGYLLVLAVLIVAKPSFR